MANQDNTSLKEIAQDTGQLIQETSQRATTTVIEKSQKYSDAYVTMNKIIEGFWERVPYIIIGVVVFLMFWLLSKLFKKIVTKALFDRSYTRQNLVLVLHRVGSTAILFFGFLIALVIIIPGFSPGQLVSALGIGSVAIGFAFKDIFQNLLSGILILISEPFKIGDAIVVNGLEGTVEDIQIRATFLRSYDGRRIVIPNATVYTSAVIVNTAYQHRRCEFLIGIDYEENIKQASDLILGILNNDREVLSTPMYTVDVAELMDTKVNLRVRWWIDVKDSSMAASVSNIQTQVKEAFEQAKISNSDEAEEEDSNPPHQEINPDVASANNANASDRATLANLRSGEHPR
ncbi:MULTISPECIES: mechanosensitive ion channel family protein [unclassified Acinetobacter]|uniref:mechanosensitive ion channel family protein n=1 Tax=unclassified Acinetobacter TaxID=196816 RepID=UPI0035BB81ED